MATSHAEPVLTVKQLAAVFDVTEMTIYNWRKETPNKTALPKKCTPSAIKRWADGNFVRIRILPERVLAKIGRGKPGPKTNSLRRNAAGKLSGVRVARGG